MSASLRSRPSLRTAANRRGGRVEDGRGSLGHAATLRFPSPLIEPDVRISRIRLSDWLHRKAHGPNHYRKRHLRGVSSAFTSRYSSKCRRMIFMFCKIFFPSSLCNSPDCGGAMLEEILASTAQRICVIAAPGSGKTKRILIPKAVQILENADVDPRNVLLLTFSRLSAKDLKDRVRSMGDRAPRATTVHSLCLSFLLSENDHDMRSRVESILLDFEKDTLLWDLKLTFPHIPKPDLRRAGPERVGAPADVVGAETLDERSHKSSAYIRLGNERGCEQLAHISVDVAHPVLRRDVGEVAGPGDASGALELCQRLLRVAADVAVGRVIDDEVELRPILRRLTDVGDIGEAALCKQSLDYNLFV
jgi:hypothetical protein